MDLLNRYFRSSSPAYHVPVGAHLGFTWFRNHNIRSFTCNHCFLTRRSSSARLLFSSRSCFDVERCLCRPVFASRHPGASSSDTVAHTSQPSTLCSHSGWLKPIADVKSALRSWKLGSPRMTTVDPRIYMAFPFQFVWTSLQVPARKPLHTSSYTSVVSALPDRSR